MFGLALFDLYHLTSHIFFMSGTNMSVFSPSCCLVPQMHVNSMNYFVLLRAVL